MEKNLNQNLLSSLQRISTAAIKCDLNFEKLTDASQDITDISEFLGITTDQAVFFSCLTELSFQQPVTYENLANHLLSSVLKILTYMPEIEALEKKGYIEKSFRKRGRKQSYNDISILVPHYVIEALRKSDASLLVSATKFDLPGFLKQAHSIVEERQENKLTTAQALSEIEFLISMNKDLPYVAFIDNTLSLTMSKCTMFALSYVRLKGQYNVSIVSFSNAVFDNLSEQLLFAQEVMAGNHELIMKNLLQIVTSELDGEKTAILSVISAKALYQEYPALLSTNDKNSGLISGKTVTVKKLFFSEDVREQVRTLEEVLKPSKFRAYRKELQRNKLSRGITSIFFGEPGTGKTEAVYQIARKTGRDIMMVDLSQTKSKWFGESEKVVKKIFDDYAALLKTTDTEPILFINEADGLLTKRTELNGGSTATEQSINTIQNILLQALENFDGILLATTNLTNNLDIAFERRFTFRISFPKPDAKVRQSIWRNKMPELSQSDAARLGERFEITGGEIDVHIRQVILKKVLNKKVDLFDTLIDCCSKDHGFSGKRRIGF
jgi:SpoVK/Ycf46/Vps4 family AAA+-type ATPase